MFLFRRKKDNAAIDEKALEESTQIALKEKSEKPEKPAKAAKKAAAKTSASEKDAPVKVVIPASALKDEEDAGVAQEKAEIPQSTVPDEVVDKLLVPVKRNNPEESSISVESILQKGEKSAKTPAPAAPAPAIQAPALAAPPSLTPPPAPQGTAPENKKEEKPKEEAKKAVPEGENKENLFSNLFSKSEVVEETPLDRLIKSLPDVTIEEVINEAEEVKGLMNEWFQNQAK